MSSPSMPQMHSCKPCKCWTQHTSAGLVTGAPSSDCPDMQPARGRVARALQGQRLRRRVACVRLRRARAAPRLADGCTRRGPPAALRAAPAVGAVLPLGAVACSHAAVCVMVSASQHDRCNSYICRQASATVSFCTLLYQGCAWGGLSCFVSPPVQEQRQRIQLAARRAWRQTCRGWRWKLSACPLQSTAQPR